MLGLSEKSTEGMTLMTEAAFGGKPAVRYEELTELIAQPSVSLCVLRVSVPPVVGSCLELEPYRHYKFPRPGGIATVEGWPSH